MISIHHTVSLDIMINYITLFSIVFNDTESLVSADYIL